MRTSIWLNYSLAIKIEHSIIIFITCLLFGCNTKVAEHQEVAKKEVFPNHLPNNIYVLKEELPLDFATINLNQPSRRIKVSDGKEALITRAIRDYMNSLGSELPTEYQPCLGTIWLKASSHDIYFVLLKHFTGVLNAKVIVNNSYANSPLIFDYNIHAMYAWKNDRIVKTDLLGTLFGEIPLVSISTTENADEMLIELNRLYHNGTANLIENLIFKIDNLNQVDTINYSLDVIEISEEEEANCDVKELTFLKNTIADIRVIPLNEKCFHEINFDDDPYLEKLVFFELVDQRRGFLILQESGNYNVLGIHQEGLGAAGEISDLSWVETLTILPVGEKIYATVVDSISGDILGVDSTAHHELKYQGVQFGVEEAGGGAVLYWQRGGFKWLWIE